MIYMDFCRVFYSYINHESKVTYGALKGDYSNGTNNSWRYVKND